MEGIAERIKLSKFWLAFFVSKCFWWLFAVLVYGRLTQLGDTETYLNWPLTFYPEMLYNSTHMMGLLGSASMFVFRIPLLANLPFALLTFFSIKYAVTALGIRKSPLLFLLISIPSFAVWTSICSKESMSVFYGAIIVVYLIQCYEKPRWPKWFELLAIYLFAVFKPFNALFVFEVLTFFVFIRLFKIRQQGILLLFMIALAVNIAGLYYFRDYLDTLSRNMSIFFNYENAQSNRPNTIWVEQYDIFKNAPYAMFIGFIGPTFTEMLRNPLHLIAGLESYFILFLMVYLLWPSLQKLLVAGKIDITYLVAIILIFLGLLFVQSLYGALNPGSAGRSI